MYRTEPRWERRRERYRVPPSATAELDAKGDPLVLPAGSAWLSVRPASVVVALLKVWLSSTSLSPPRPPKAFSSAAWTPEMLRDSMEGSLVGRRIRVDGTLDTAASA